MADTSHGLENSLIKMEQTCTGTAVQTIGTHLQPNRTMKWLDLSTEA